MVPLGFRQDEPGGFPGEGSAPKASGVSGVLRSGSDRPTLIRQHRLVRGLNLAASPGAGDTDRYPGLPSHAHPPSLPPSSLPGSSPPVRRRGRPGCSRPSRPGPEPGGAAAPTSLPRPKGGVTGREGGRGAGRGPRTRETRAGRGLGRRSLGCPHPQAGASPSLPSGQTKDRRPGTRILSPAPGREGVGGGEGGVSLPGASAPGPWAPPPDRRTAGQWAPGCGSGRPGRALRDRAPQAGGGQLRAEPRGGGAEGGRRCETDKAQRQTDGRTEGEKMATRAAGARCSRTGSGRGACTSLPPSARAAPSPGSRARARGMGGACGGKRGSREAGLEGAANRRRPS